MTLQSMSQSRGNLSRAPPWKGKFFPLPCSSYAASPTIGEELRATCSLNSIFGRRHHLRVRLLANLELISSPLHAKLARLLAVDEQNEVREAITPNLAKIRSSLLNLGRTMARAHKLSGSRTTLSTAIGLSSARSSPGPRTLGRGAEDPRSYLPQALVNLAGEDGRRAYRLWIHDGGRQERRPHWPRISRVA